MEQNNLEKFLTKLFGKGKSEVNVKEAFETCIGFIMANDAL
jgi:hypothetical protein